MQLVNYSLFFLNAEKIRKGFGLLPVNGLKVTVEETGCLKVQSGRARKLVSEDTIKNVATATVSRAQDNITCTSSARGVARNLDMYMPHCTVCKILRKIIRFYTYKIRRVHKLRHTDLDRRLTFVLNCLARMQVDDACSW